jgi:large subunit ribosomal protein L35
MRFKVSATGKVLRRSNYAGHIMTKKTTKRKRRLRQARPVAPGDARGVKRMLLAE